VDDYIAITNDVSLNITEQITLSAWVKPLNTGLRALIIDGIKYQLRLNGLKAEFLINDSDANEANAYGNIILQGSAIPENTWSHLTATYDYISRKMQIYINGCLNASITTSGGDGKIGALDYSRYISRSGDTFKGVIDDARIYNACVTNFNIFNR
ncbi:MAG TPA: hypothetical protein DC049_11660, partial [Spirochaetia bacterium]|nr:hypothetical protein [Spirochaetia bacterium]